MTVQAVTLNLPETVYEQIWQAAEKAQRPVNEVLVEAVTAVAPVIGIAPEKLRTALAQMAYLNDAPLWQAARATMTTEQRERLEALHDQQQREGLTIEKQAEVKQDGCRTGSDRDQVNHRRRTDRDGRHRAV